MRIAASLFGSANPTNVSLVTMPAGGTSPTRDPGGKIGSAAWTGLAITINANTVAKPAEALRQRKLLLLTMQSLCCPSGPGVIDRAPRDPAQCQIDPTPFPEQA